MSRFLLIFFGAGTLAAGKREFNLLAKESCGKPEEESI